MMLMMTATLHAAEPAIGGSYVVTIDADKPLLAHVEAHLPAGSRALHMATWGASQMPNGWASFVSGLTAGDVRLEAGPNATWTATETSAGAPLHLRYDVDLSFTKTKWPAGNEQAGLFENGALFLVSKALFIVSDAAGARHVTFRVPKDWKVATPWTPAGNHKYEATDLADLINNSIVLGTFNARELSVDDFKVTLALLGRMEASHELVAETLRKVLHAYGEVFGDVPRGQYLLTLFAADETDAEAYASSAAFTERDALTSNNRIGWGNTIAHELFHSWNGIRIAGHDYPSSQWLGEGFTEYFANLALVQEGLISTTLFRSMIEKNLGLYTCFRSSPLFADVSLVDAGKNKRRNRLGVYEGGWAAAFTLDMEIRHLTGGRRTLRDFMRAMLTRYGATPYSIEDVIAVASDVAGADMSSLFQRYVIGTEMLPLEESLRRAGYDVHTPFYTGALYISPNATKADSPASTR
jgi:predicted metalloprotease with PDZ domain